MLHSEFVEKYRRGLITVTGDKNKAGYIYESPWMIPDRLRTQQALIRTLAFGGTLGGIAAFFFAPW